MSDPSLLECRPTNDAEKKNSHFWQSLQDLSRQKKKKKKSKMLGKNKYHYEILAWEAFLTAMA